MNIVGQKNHGYNLFSFDNVDESFNGRRRLSDFLRLQIQVSECVVCLCERPLFNQSVKELIQSKNFAFSHVQDIKYDDFELSFSTPKESIEDEIISLLCDCFCFFEHPAFIFLSRESDVDSCKAFCKRNKDWKNITDNFECCFVFKSVEDDVVWYKLSRDVGV